MDKCELVKLPVMREPDTAMVYYQLRDESGHELPGEAVEAPRENETAGECVRRLIDEFGDRIVRVRRG